MVMRGVRRLILILALIFATVLTLGTTLAPEQAGAYRGGQEW
jgi:hypothetical protein